MVSGYSGYSEELKSILENAKNEISNATDSKQLNDLRVKYLGKSGIVTSLMKKLKDLPPEERPNFGKVVNELKDEIEGLLEERKSQLMESEKQLLYKKLWVDPTMPGARRARGHLHIITKVQKELEDIFISMGFSVVEGPEIEQPWFNFDALNTPEWHPARDAHDSFYINDEYMLRTHTSPVQIRTMLSRKPPLAIVAPGRVYRRDYDATHLPMFTQMEGLYVDHDVTVKHLKYFLEEFARRLLGENTKVRLRPSYFPFTEPSFEVDIYFNNRWFEVLGAGMVHPNVFKNVGYDPEEWRGLAFGLGIERIAMVKYGVKDIRDLVRNDIRFLENW
ncbi:phenylalanyl-tRNA synthetase, alpha subunit [Fervidobacterium pennivorans DSM 9078]|jgi:phenylalanyl-tRNA synthetase alpha chain|uniref:Phenylalanine--tRNA ligase alpha subunit n=1 Tax=Fervidobacterium pennivorans (strain DSM 9078 / Ven5) TaxID=771875 RepID=H9UCV2_FERPD|nr:phenylalanine--tRNA ligase subunit alpha [Fervidobacterium pennivorans]AFG35345.1 phenylalanyl-tRNA synthetase, alpha subunit [Fervidobacterium pennivorans DSM 9078]QIV78299.1 phenylalanine--tRNA ligase subunit alpha [Fervidobacterium pennivorans subsp. keratinolyticus]